MSTPQIIDQTVAVSTDSTTNQQNISECLKKTADEQLNANLTQLVKILITSLQDGTIPVKNSTRLQNLTVNDILELAKKNTPVQEIKNFITENGTNIVEMIQSYTITRDTKFVTSANTPYKLITRKKPNPDDPTGINQITTQYIQVKLPYDLINKERIVAVYFTTINESNEDPKSFISNEVLFDYTLDIDPTDPKAPYILETEATNLNLGQTQVYDVSTYPNDPSKWGTWGTERFIKVTYLVDNKWVSLPQEPLPAITTPNVAITTSNPKANVIPMTYSLYNQPLPMSSNPSSKPQESINIEFDPIRLIVEDKAKEQITTDAKPYVNNIKTEAIKLIVEDQTQNDIIQKQYANTQVQDPKWLILEDPTEAKLFESYTKYLRMASRVIDQKTVSFNWSPDTDIPDTVGILIMPNNKIINQLTYNLTKLNFAKFGKDVGISSRIIEMISSNILGLNYTSSKPKFNTITGEETDFGLMIKLNEGEQYPYAGFSVTYTPAWIVEIIQNNFNASAYLISSKVPARVIEELTTYLNPLTIQGKVSSLSIPTRIINWLESLVISKDKDYLLLTKPARVIEENVATKEDYNGFLDHSILTFKDGAKIINEDLIGPNGPKENPIETINKDSLYYNFINNPARVLQQITDITANTDRIDIYDPKTFIDVFKPVAYNNATRDNGLKLSKLFLCNPSWVLNQEAFYPMKMEVLSGSTYYIQDLYNMKVLSSLAYEEFVPLVTAQGRQQRSEYEFVAVQDQRVFDVQHNPDLVTVYRQGFKLSHGDYYNNGQKIILKSPANAGEIINVVSERRYIFANTVTKEELSNALNQFNTERPIITYQSVVYENSSVDIKINNYDPNGIYSVSVKFEGKYRDDVVWTRRNDTINVNIPEINNVARRTLSVLIWCSTQGKLQSAPTEAMIHIKNLFDTVPDSNGQGYKRLIFGATPDEWLGLNSIKFKFDDYKTDLSNYGHLQAIPAGQNPIENPAVPERIAILKDKWYQSKVVDTTADTFDKTLGDFTGTFLDSYIGLENLSNLKLNIISTDGNETIFDSDLEHDEILTAFQNGTLYIILDSDNGKQTGYGKYKYNYQPAINYTSVLNILPRTDKVTGLNGANATWFLEHTNNLKGRNIHAMIILDIQMQVDFDFTGLARINETTNVIETTFPLESVEYKVQDNVPFLVGTINDQRIPNLTNPYINIGSKVMLQTSNNSLNALQNPTSTTNLDDKPLVVNNIYAEKIFSGLVTNLIPKDNFQDTLAILKDSMYYKKFYPYSNGSIGSMYDTYYKKDFFMLNEENVKGITDLSTSTLKDKCAISMARFISDHDVATDTPTYSARLKEIAQTPTTKDSFKMIYPIPSEDYSPGSEYQANFALAQYGGSAQYVIDSNSTTAECIEQKITFQKVYIKNSDTGVSLKSGRVPGSASAVTDGYHTLLGQAVTKRIPTWWDVVLRPSVRPQRQDSLRKIWYLIRDNVSLSDANWLTITDGILRKPEVTLDNNLNGLLHRDFEITSIQDNPGLLLMGGEGYRPTLTRKESHTISVDYLNSITPGYGSPTNLGKYFVNEAKWAYYHRNQARGHMATRTVYKEDGSKYQEQYWVDDHGWLNQTEIMKIDYGWENSEPYVEFVWGQYFTYQYKNNTYSGIKLFVDRVSRVKCMNGSIYHLDLTKLDKYNPDDNAIFPSFITKIYNSNYSDIFKDPIEPTNPSKAITGMANFGLGFNSTSDQRANFIDSIYEAGHWWFLIRPAFSKDTKLFKLDAEWSLDTSPTTSGGIKVTRFTFSEATNLHYDYSANPFDWSLGIRTDTNYSKWSFIPDITGTLRGDGPILIKHQEQVPLKSPAPTQGYGIYYFDTWDNLVYKKSSSPIPNTSILFGIQEVAGIRNPYIMQFDPIGPNNNGIENKIDIIGSRFFIIMYLDKILSKMTKEEFLLFKEEILHLNNGAIPSNPNKLITIFDNIIPLKIKAIIPDGDSYKANSAQVIFDRVSTQTGRKATNFVFRVSNLQRFTNRLAKPIELDSIRFATV